MSSDSIFSGENNNSDNKAIEKLDDALNETKQRLAVLESHLATADSTLVTDESRNAVWKISRSYFDWVDWRSEVCSTLYGEKYPDMAIKIVKQLFDTGPAVDDATCKFSFNLITSLWNFSKFDNFRTAVASAGAIPLCLDYLATVHMYLEHIAEKEPPEQYPVSKWTIVKVVLNLLHQLAKQQRLIKEFVSSKAADILGNFTKVDSKPVQLSSACCLAFLTSSTDLENLTAVLSSGLERALEDVEHPHYQGLDLEEIADALYLLLAKSSPDLDSYDTTARRVFTEEVKIRVIALLIESEKDSENLSGALLFKSYCNKEYDVNWLQPVFNASTLKNDPRADRAGAFLEDYQKWLKTRHGNNLRGAYPFPVLEASESFKMEPNSTLDTLEMAKSETELRVKFLAKLAELTPDMLVTNDIENVWQLLSDGYVEFDTEWRIPTIDIMIKEGLAVVVAKYLAYFIHVGLNVPKTYGSVLGLLGTLWNCTDVSPQFRLELGKAGVLKIMLDYLAEAKKVDQTDRTSEENHIIFIMINTVYNMSRSMELKAEFLENDAVNTLREFLGMSELIKSIVTLCLAHILTDTPEATKIADDEGVVPSIVGYANIAMNSDRMCMLTVRGAGFGTMSVGYSLEELVEGLALLAVNDSIKEALMQNGVCKIISYLLKSGAPNLEIFGVDLIWTLSFVQSARIQIIESGEDILGSLRPLVTSTETTPQIREHAAKTLSFIENWQQKMKEVESGLKSSKGERGGQNSHKPTDGHIFISYSWKQQSTVLRIKQELLKHNYTVWMDVEKMHGDLLEAMATAVEKAVIVLLCFSNSYKQSNPCRTEAQYAHALCKPIVPVNMEYHYFPDGWLGILVRSRKFVDMSLEKRTFEDAVEQLLVEIKSFSAEAIPDENGPQQPLGGGHATVPLSYPPKEITAVSTRKVSSWSVEDVKSWLERENLSEFTSALSDFDGKMLATLFAMKSTAPDFYYKTMAKHYNGSLQGLLQLLGIIDRLWLE